MVAHSALYKNERFASCTRTHTHTHTHTPQLTEKKKHQKVSKINTAYHSKQNYNGDGKCTSFCFQKACFVSSKHFHLQTT